MVAAVWSARAITGPPSASGVQGRTRPCSLKLATVAGSHRYHKRPYAWGEEGDLPIVALETEPGDLTLHFGDTMHSTPPPTSPTAGRRVLYYKFAQPKTFAWVPPGCHYNDALFAVDELGHAATRATAY